MLVALLAVTGTVLSTENIVWLDAHEARERRVFIPCDGECHVWTWSCGAPRGRLSRKGIHLRADNMVGAKFAWHKAGTFDAAQGEIDVALGEGIAAIVLTTIPDYAPNRVMPDLRVMWEPVCSGDVRAFIERDTNTRYDMTAFASRADWERFAEALRRRILVSCGLWPMPERTPLNARVFDPIQREDYVVEKVHFEAFPGFLVTGNLYRPIGNGPFPAAICPHGHWKSGRFENTEVGSVPGRCITLARMGIAAFSYDMIGYNDSRQFSHGWTSRLGNSPEEGRKIETLWGIHPFALQLWSSVRALDFLESLPYVDRDRLACTGASGGGTQTFAVTAVDPRVKVCAPVNMISHSMQGGCICENAPLIRVAASNMEIGALAAPRPMLMVSATGDWTRATPEIEYPAIRGIYELYGAGDRVANVHIDAGHNYNRDSREAVYRFFGAFLLGDEARWAEFDEPDFVVEPLEQLAVFPGEEAPTGYPNGAEIIERLVESRRAQWQALLPRDPGALDAFRKIATPALEDAFGLSALPRVSAREIRSIDHGDYRLEHLVISAASGNAIPALTYRRMNADSAGAAVVVHDSGKAALVDLKNGGPGPVVREQLDAGKVVIVIDPFLIGEHHAPDRPTQRVIKSFPETFLPTDDAYRVQDVLAAAAYARSRTPGAVAVIGIGKAGLWSLFAAAVDAEIASVTADVGGFNPEDDGAWVAQCYAPSLRAIGGAATAAALIAPRPLKLVVEGDGAVWKETLGAYLAISRRGMGEVVQSRTASPA